jgi:hypothetical protein
MGPDGGWILWTTSETTCAEDAQRCRNRLLGIARPREEEPEPSPRHWLGAHPLGRIDRSIRFDLAAGWVVAPSEAGGLEAARFTIDPEAPVPDAERPVPTAATQRVALGRALDVLLAADGPVWVTREGSSVEVRGVPGVPEGPAISIPLGDARAPRTGEALLTRCGAWTALAMPHGIWVMRAERGLHFHLSRALREPVLGAGPEDDAMRLVCREDGVDVLALDRERALVRWACDDVGCEAAPDLLARGARAFDAAHAGGVTAVAWSGDVQHPQIRVRRVRGDVIGAPEVPAPCWDEGLGMCGNPYVVAEGAHLLVAAREQADLLVLEMAETGWRRLEGL